MACQIQVNTLDYLHSKELVSKTGLVSPKNETAVREYIQYVDSFMETKYGVKADFLSLEKKQKSLFLKVNSDAFNDLQILAEEAIDLDAGYELYYNIDPFFAAPEQQAEPEWRKTIMYKQNLLFKARSRLKEIRNEKKKYSDDAKKLIELSAQEKFFSDRINGDGKSIIGLATELARLHANPNLTAFLTTIPKELDRVELLLTSEDPRDLEEASRIIEYYIKLGTFSNKYDNPLFSKDDMFNEHGELTIDTKVVNLLKDYKERAELFESRLYQSKKNAVMAHINGHSKTQKFYKGHELEYGDVFGARKDTHWVDNFIADVTNGIFSSNGIAPQVAMLALRDSIEENKLRSQEIEKKYDKLKDRLVETLRREGYSLKNGIKGVSYEIFRAKSLSGNKQDRIVQRFTEKYENAVNKIEREYREEILKANTEINPVTASNKRRKANLKREKWYTRNTILIDIYNNEELKAEFQDAFPGEFAEEIDRKNKAELIKVLGEQGYKEAIERQRRLIRDYLAAVEVQIDNYMVEEGVSDIDKLSTAALQKIERWRTVNSPINFSNMNLRGERINNLNSSRRFAHSVPRRHPLQRDNMTLKTRENTKENTGFYDPNFAIIEKEGNEALKEFHDLIMEFQTLFYDSFPPEIQDKMNMSSLPQLTKTVTEVLFDPNMEINERILGALRVLWDKFKEFFSINVHDSISQAAVNPLTGIPEYKVMPGFTTSNKMQIEQRYQVEKLRLLKALYPEADADLLSEILDEKGKKDPLNMPIDDALENPDVVNILAEAFGTINNKRVLKSRIGQDPKTTLGFALREAITHQVVSEQSFDLPKMIKYFSHLAMEYKSRQDALPIISMIKEHYENIDAPVTNNLGEVTAPADALPLTGKRKRGIDQFEAWFNRVVLNNYGSKTPSYLNEEKMEETRQLAIRLGKRELKFKMGKVLTGDDRYILNKIQEIKEGLPPESELYKALEEQENAIGRSVTVGSIYEGFLKFVRVKVLGWNPFSQITNFIEGQTANFQMAASGLRFTPENIYRANSIVQESVLKNITFGKVQSKSAKKLRTLMDRYTVLQDASNELQKASQKTSLTGLSALSPFSLIQRVEYVNQSPLLVAMLLDKKVTSKDGQSTLSVWDAMDENGEFLPEFDTEENRANWVEHSTQEFKDFFSELMKLIVDVHGDYDALRGMKISDSNLGKSILMFKRWLPKQIAKKVGVEQVDLESGTTIKGQYRSHTTASSTVHGAIAGLSGALLILPGGPLGIVAGAAIGGIMSRFNKQSKNVDSIGSLREMAEVTREVFISMLRIPVNNITGKTIIREPKLTATFQDELDAKNYTANITDMAINLMYTAMIILVKMFSSFLTGDDDEEEGTYTKAAEMFLVNRLLSLSEQASMFLSPTAVVNNLAGEIAVLKFFEDVGKTLDAFVDMVNGDNIILAGANVGQGRFQNQFRKTFIPSIGSTIAIPLATSSFLTQSQFQKQYAPTPFDDLFIPEDDVARREIRKMKVKDKGKLIDDKMPDKEKQRIQKKLDAIYRKRVKETYPEALERAKKQIKTFKETEKERKKK